MTLAYLNGEYLPLNEAKISALDRGFLFADGIYEVIPVYHRKAFLLAEHITRLHQSLAGIQLSLTDEPDWGTVIKVLLDDLPNPTASLYLQITRGADSVRKHALPDKPIQPTIFATCFPCDMPTVDQLQLGGTAITVEDLRWKCNYIKATALLANVLMNHQARSQQVNDAILINDGYAVEAAASNIFIIENKVLITPPHAPHILPGITRSVILKLAEHIGYQTQERPIKKAELFTADEVWLTSSTQTIRPVIEIDGKNIADGTTGPVWHDIIQAYLNYIEHYNQSPSLNFVTPCENGNP